MGRFKRKIFRHKVIQKQFLQHIPNEKRHLDRFSDRVTSDTPTAYFAPEDYIHIYNNQIQKTENKKSPAILSDCPTALIAPEDYQHIYSQSKTKAKTEILRQISETNIQAGPTVLIAPTDYVHIYKRSKSSSLSRNKKSFLKKNINLKYNRKKKSQTKLNKGKPVEMRIGIFTSDWNEPDYMSLYHESEQLLACYPFRFNGGKLKRPNISVSKSTRQSMLVGPELPILKTLYDKISKHLAKPRSYSRINQSEVSLNRQMIVMGKDSLSKRKKSISLSRKKCFLLKKSLSKTKFKSKPKLNLRKQSNSKLKQISQMRIFSFRIEESEDRENSGQDQQQLVDCCPYLYEYQMSNNIKRNNQKNQNFSLTSLQNITLFHPNVPIVKSLHDVINLY